MTPNQIGINPNIPPNQTRYEFVPATDMHPLELPAIICMLKLIVLNEHGYQQMAHSGIKVIDEAGNETQLVFSRHFKKVEESPIVLATGPLVR